MGFQSFREVRFSGEKLELIRKCNEVVERYQGQGLRLTLRQLYYQLVSQNVIENKERSYKNLGNTVSDGRLAGLIDWSAIEDRVRVPRAASEFADLHELAEAALSSYRLPRWQGQPHYVELWVEKDALAGVLWPLAHEHHVTLMVNRGYSSQSAMFEAANRFKEAASAGVGEGGLEDRELTLFYLGDHDPSGEDMVRDIADRLAMFEVPDLHVEKLALTKAQIRQHRPPPNPAKVTDPRAAKYIAEHGPVSWEVDALPPEVLSRLIREAFARVVDVKLMDQVKRQEARDKKELERAVAGIMRKRS